MEPMTRSAGEWDVVATRPYDPGDSAKGMEETVLVQAVEEEARRVYADEIAAASERGYQYVKLRCAGTDVDCWPPATGWTS